MEPEEKAVSRQWLNKRIFAATITHATTEELLAAVFSVLSVLYQMKLKLKYAMCTEMKAGD